MNSEYIAIGYFRRSTDEKKKQVQSIPTQKVWSEKRSRHEGDSIEFCFVDKQTAKEPGRKGFGEMMKFIYESKKPIKLYTWKTSRLSRNPIDEGAIKYAIQQGKIKYIVTRERSYDENTSHILLGVDFGEATQYSIDLSRDVIDGMNSKVRKGIRPTCTPLGWLNDPYGVKGEKQIFTDPKRFYTLRGEIQKILKSHGRYKVADSLRFLRSSGFRTKRGVLITKAVLYRLYTNPFICGEFLWQDQWHLGAWEPMITPTEFETLQVLIGRGGARNRKHNPLFNGFIKCAECGGCVTTESPKIKYQKNGNVHIYHYLRCTKNNGPCSQKCIRAEKVEQGIAEVLSDIEISDEFMDFCLGRIRQELKSNKQFFETQHRTITRRLNENQAYQMTLTEKYAQGKIPEELYQTMLKDYQRMEFALGRELREHRTGRDANLKMLRDKIKFTHSAAKTFKTGGIAKKKNILAQLQSNLWLKDGELVVELSSPLCIFSRFKTPKPFTEPLKHTRKQGKVQLVDMWSSWWELIRTCLNVKSLVIQI